MSEPDQLRRRAGRRPPAAHREPPCVRRIGVRLPPPVDNLHPVTQNTGSDGQ